MLEATIGWKTLSFQVPIVSDINHMFQTKNRFFFINIHKNRQLVC